MFGPRPGGRSAPAQTAGQIEIKHAGGGGAQPCRFGGCQFVEQRKMGLQGLLHGFPQRGLMFGNGTDIFRGVKQVRSPACSVFEVKNSHFRKATLSGCSGAGASA